MDIKLPPAAEEYRARVRALLAQELPADWRGVAAPGPEEGATFEKRGGALLVEQKLLPPRRPSG